MRKNHVLFEGRLTDAPSRAETWTEYVRYLGSNRWKLTVKGTDFSGTAQLDAFEEKMGTKALLEWVIDRDSEFGSNETDLSQRVSNLLKIAKLENAVFCLKCIKSWREGNWSPYPKPVAAPRILDIVNALKKTDGRFMHTVVFDVETNRGSGILSDPNKNSSYAQLTLKNENNWSHQHPNRFVKIPKKFLAKIDKLKRELD